jgi:hypothetical protein
MIGQFNAVITALQNFFSKEYLLQGLLPMFVLMAGIFTLFAPSSPLRLRILMALGSQSFSWSLLPFALFFLFGWSLLAWIWWAANPGLRSILEGEVWLLRRPLLYLEEKKLAEWEDRILEAKAEVALYGRAVQRDFPQRLSSRLIMARRAGAGRPAGSPSKAVLKALGDIKAHLARVDITPIGRFEALADRLEQELTAGDAEVSSELRKAHEKFDQLLRKAKDKVEAIDTELSTRRYFRFPIAGLGATELANRIRAQKALLFNSYQFDVDAFLPHILLKLSGDKESSEKLGKSTTLLGTSVAFCMVFLLLTAATLVAVTIRALPVPWAIVSWTVYPTAAYAFYRVAVIGATAMMEDIRAIVDIKRFDLLKDLHVTLPLNPVAERAIWDDLAQQLLSKDYIAQRITYNHP